MRRPSAPRDLDAAADREGPVGAADESAPPAFDPVAEALRATEERDAGAARPEKIEGIVVARVCRIDACGHPFVDFDGNPLGRPVRAHAVVGASPELGSEVAVSFDAGEVGKPVVLGPMARVSRHPRDAASVTSPLEIDLDRDLVVRCGASTLSVGLDGSICISGVDLVTRAARDNRIVGGTVRIN